MYRRREIKPQKEMGASTSALVAVVMILFAAVLISVGYGIRNDTSKVVGLAVLIIGVLVLVFSSLSIYLNPSARQMEGRQMGGRQMGSRQSISTYAPIDYEYQTPPLDYQQ